MTDQDLVDHIKERQKFHQEMIDKYQACLRVLDEIKYMDSPLTESVIIPEDSNTALQVKTKDIKKHTHTCIECGTSFESSHKVSKYCSKKCSLKFSGRKWYEKQKAKKEQVHPDITPTIVVKDESKKKLVVIPSTMDEFHTKLIKLKEEARRCNVFHPDRPEIIRQL